MAPIKRIRLLTESIASHQPLLSILALGLMLPAAAQAGTCMSYEAAYQLESLLAEGMRWRNALQTVIDEGYFDGSHACLKAIKQQVNQSPYAFPEIEQAVYRRSVR